ncbi:MAG: hypothetical protein AAGJ82_10225, partial [Bacteroidota bacterium]
MERFKHRQSTYYVWRLGLLLWLSITGLGNVLGQGLLYDYYAIREGLSNRLVRDVVFDESNLVWLGTGNGLNRFDGYGFEQFFDNDSA